MTELRPSAAADELSAHAVIRLLEDGDRDDLRSLTDTVGEADLVSLFAARGGRQLSSRSRAFWSLLLGVDPAPPHPCSAEIWPL